MSPKEFSELLRTAEGRIQKQLAKKLYKSLTDITRAAARNFTGDDLPDVKRVRNTSKSRTGGPVGSTYKKWVSTGNSGFLVGPRAITGHLRRSISQKLSISNGKIRGFVTAGIKEPVAYAAALEYGSPKRNIAPRLYIGKAVMKIKPDLSQDLLDAVDVSFKSWQG
jgi:hypothetical protein